jgi:hypothetical protein
LLGVIAQDRAIGTLDLQIFDDGPDQPLSNDDWQLP